MRQWSTMKKLIWLRFLQAASAILKTVTGSAPITLTNAIALAIHSLTQTGKCEQRNLPAGYTQVAYIESDGTDGYVDTGIIGRPNTKIECQVEWLSFYDSAFLASGDWENNTRFYLCYCLNANGEFTVVPSLKIDKRDIKGTVGAGDAFCSGILYGAHSGYTLVESMRLAGACAACSLSESNGTDGMRSLDQTLALCDIYG